MKKHLLLEFFNDQADWLEYYETNEDFSEGYRDYLIDTIDYEKARLLIPDLVVSDYQIKEVVENIGTVQRSSSYYPKNALSYANIDEIEVQLSGLSDDSIEDLLYHYSNGLEETEISNFFRDSRLSENCILNGDFIYYRPNFDSIQLLVDTEEFINEILK